MDREASSAPPPRRVPWLPIIGLGLVAAATGVAIGLLNSRQESPAASTSPTANLTPSAQPPSASTTPSPSASAGPAQSPAAPGAVTGVTWNPAGVIVGEGFVRRATAEGGLFYVLGAVGQDAVIWSSADGQSWNESVLPFPASWTREPPVFVSAGQLATLDGQLIALGTVGALDNLNVVVWESNDGVSWTEIDTGPFMGAAFNARDVTTGPGGLVAATHGYGTGTGSAWLSADIGHTWTEHRPAGESIEIVSVVGTGSGYLMAGSVGAAAPGSPASPRIWSSADGAGWTEETLEGGDAVGLVEQLTVNGSGQWVAVGSLDGEAVAWRRADDESWVLASEIRPLAQSFVGDFLPSDFRLAGLPNGFVALDLVEPMTTWISADGSTWTSAGHPGPTGLQGDVPSFAAGIARLGGTLLVAGEDVGSQGEHFGWYAWMGTVQD